MEQSCGLVAGANSLFHDSKVMHDELFARNGLSLERLRAFVEIVAAGSPTRAAQGDATRQSQYSRQLKELEEFFGGELFVKRKGIWSLTESGRQLHQLVNEHLGSLTALRCHCANAPVPMRLGAGESFLQWRLLPRLAELQEQSVGVRFILLNRRSEAIAAGLVSGDLEAGILPAQEVPASLKSIALAPVEFRFFVPADFVQTRGQTPGMAELLSAPLALLEGNNALRELLQTESLRLGIKLNVLVECSSHLQLAEVVRNKIAAAVLPADADKHLPEGEICVLELPILAKVARRLRLAWNPKMIRSRPAVQAAIRAFCNLKI
jgi:DNA-binding transcriptional LysR family regulator